MGTVIHAGAHVDSAAVLGVDVEVMPGAVITRWARIGDRTVVHPGAVIGGDPQYLAFKRETPTWVEVGADCVLREGVTLNRSIYEDEATTLGDRCFFMANSHAGHDAQVSHDVVLANGALLGGHVAVGEFCFIGGNAAVHQFCRIGPVVMIGGLSPITSDVPPYCMVADRNEVSGLNLVGLKRRGWPREAIREVKDAYRAVMRPTGNMRTIAAELLPDVTTEQARVFLAFFAGGGKRPIARPRRGREDDETGSDA